MNNCDSKTIFFVSIILISATAFAIPGQARPAQFDSQQTDSPPPDAIEISECQTIDEPGYYILTEDIVNSTARHCINIVSSDVIFDGQGHLLHAKDVDKKTEGVAAGYQYPLIENITIKNVVVEGWVQGIGCRQVANDVVIRNVTARWNGWPGYGIYVGEYTNNVTVVDNVAVNNSRGIIIDETNDTVIRDNLVTDNEFQGIYLGPEAWDNRIVDNRVISNDGPGITVAATNRSVVGSNRLEENKAGILVSRDAADILVKRNQIVRTASEGGIIVETSVENVTVRSNVLEAVRFQGIALESTNRTVIKNNTIVNPGTIGIDIEGHSRANRLLDNRIDGGQRGLVMDQQAQGTIVEDLEISDTDQQAILVQGAGNQSLYDLLINRSRGGIEIKSAEIRIRKANIRNTDRYGIRVDGGRNVTLSDIRTAEAGNRMIESVGGSTSISVTNLSLGTGHFSVEGDRFLLKRVETIPKVPDGMVSLGVAVRIELPGESSVDVSYKFPRSVESNDSIGIWAYNGGWERIAEGRQYPENRTVSGRVSEDVIVAPLGAVQDPTPATEGSTNRETRTIVSKSHTKSHSPAPTSSRETASITATPIQTPGQPGFGIMGSLIGVLLGISSTYRRR